MNKNLIFKMIFIGVSIFTFLGILVYSPELLLFIFPGILSIHSKHNIALKFIQKISLVPAISISFWICSFALTKFIPVQTTVLIYFVIFVSFIFFLIQIISISTFKLIRLQVNDILGVLFVGLVIVAFIQLNAILIVPAGADMATHTYTARVIANNNHFPTTHEPTVPIPTFGFAPYGLSTIIAIDSLISHKPVYESSLFVTSLVYPFAVLSLMFFLAGFFPVLSIIVVILSILFVERDLLWYLSWGGNQTIVSVSLLFFAIGWVLYVFKVNKFTTVSAYLTALFLGASFYTHQTGLAVFLFVFSPVILYVFMRRQKNYRMFIIKTILFLSVLLLPFITSLRTLPETSSELIRSHTQQYEQIISSNVKDIIPSIMSFISSRLGHVYVVLASLGMVISFIRRNYTGVVLSIGVLGCVILLINSALWILPFSELFYPDRVTTILNYFFTFFVCYFLIQVLEMIDTIGKKSNRYLRVILFAVFILSILYYLKNVPQLYNFYVLTVAANESSVTENDLEAFKWIEMNTQKDAVFLNNYGDAGVWIPAMINRKVTWNDYNMHYKDLIEEGQKKLVPKYLYIGDKQVYPKSISFDVSLINNDKQYVLLYESGNSKIYKLIE